MPLYVRAGAIVPLDPVRQYRAVCERANGLQIHTGADGEFLLYDDDGRSLGCETARMRNCMDSVRWDDSARKLTIEPDKRMKKWPGTAQVLSQARQLAAT